MSFYVRNMGEMFTPCTINTGRWSQHETSYPSEWFEKNVGQKPALSIIIKYNSLETLRPIIKNQIKNHNVDLELVKEFIYVWGKMVTAVCHEDWKSFGTLIARAGEEVHPWNVLNIGVSNGDLSTAPVVSNADDFKLIVTLVGLYRVLREKNAKQKTQIARKIEEQTRATGAMNCLISLDPYCCEWKFNKDYTKMIAALDMFFFKFKEHRYSNLRAGTFMSRHRDCGALALIKDFTQLLGIDKANLLDWIFCNSISEEVKLLVSPAQEKYEQYSYFPYQIDMGIVHRSAYTTTSIPCFYFFAHGVGALLGVEKSINARLFLEKDTMRVYQNIKIVAFVFGQNQGKSSSVEKRGNSEDGLPKDIKEWLVLLQNGGQLNPAMEAFVKEAKSKITNPGKNTIGEHIKGI